MQRYLALLAALLVSASQVQAQGLLIPTERSIQPFNMVNHQVTINIEDQVAVTKIEQTFRNPTPRNLEATYIFPVPKGASVRKFTMWVDGKEMAGELVEADKARKIYTDIVQRTMDPGLLEYMGNNVMKLRVFPVPPNGDQKVSVSYTSINESDNGLVHYIYPLKADAKAATTLEKFEIKLNLKSQHPLTNVYSPSHAITMARPNENEAVIGFEKNQAVLDRDFQLFYQAGGKDIGLTSLTHRPNPSQPGYFMLLVSPRLDLSKQQQVPRDMVFVLDTSGSMRGQRMTQARAALKYCLDNLSPSDRFGVINFATTVNRYADQLQSASKDNVTAARKWVENLEATGGTAIDEALKSAVQMRPSDASRTFTVVFFTDGRPTIGETNSEKILQHVAKENTANTRVFTFGVGDDVNASMLDALADNSRAVSTYVRESEDIESKVSSLYGKISNPVLANLKLTVSDGVKFSEIYQPQLPDLFHGGQLVVMGRYDGTGAATVKLNGTVGKDEKEFVYNLNFADKTADDKSFVEDLWARRKVGYMLDQIRVNGEKKELVDEVVTLAKRYGITTPYTSYLLVPDGPLPVPIGRPIPRPFRGGGGEGRFGGINGPAPAALTPAAGAVPGVQEPLDDFARRLRDGDAKKDLGDERARLETDRVNKAEAAAEKLADGEAKQAAKEVTKQSREALDQQKSLNLARNYFQNRQHEAVQGGKLGVDFAVQNNALRNQTQVARSASRNVQNRNVMELGGVWIDEGFDGKMETVPVKAMSAAYFRILERHPEARDVFRLGNYVVWVAPSGRALVIDQNAGAEELTDAAIDALFVARAQSK